MMLSIHNLTDRPDLADLCAGWSFAEWGRHIEGRSLEQSRQRYRDTAAGRYEFPRTWVALADEKSVGMISLKMEDHPDRQDLSPWLATLFTLPEYRAQGTGSALCRRLETEAKEACGFSQLHLFTPVETFYKRLGWHTIGTVRDPAGIHKDGESLMTKILGS